MPWKLRKCFKFLYESNTASIVKLTVPWQLREPFKFLYESNTPPIVKLISTVQNIKYKPIPFMNINEKTTSKENPNFF